MHLIIFYNLHKLRCLTKIFFRVNIELCVDNNQILAGHFVFETQHLSIHSFVNIFTVRAPFSFELVVFVIHKLEFMRLVGNHEFSLSPHLSSRIEEVRFFAVNILIVASFVEQVIVVILISFALLQGNDVCICR